MAIRRTLFPMGLGRTCSSVLIALIIWLLCSPGALAATGRAVRVVDGDTIVVAVGGKNVVVRLVAIDAPETSKAKRDPGQPYGQKALRHLAGLVLDKPVELRSCGSDRYGRVLAEVFVAGVNVNLEMVKAGLAEVYRGKPAAGMNLEPYREAEEAARRNRREMWAQGDRYLSPRDWRKTEPRPY